MKKNKVIFHVGTHKTGSTALQKFLLTNKYELSENNYIYYPCNNGINHMDLSHEVDLWKGVELDPTKNYIFSSEDFFSRFNAPKAEPMIVDILEKNADKFNSFDVEIIVYLREQVDYLQSVYNELIKRHGYFKSINARIVGLNYFERLNAITNSTSKPKVLVRSYSPTKFIGGNIFTDFINGVGFNNLSIFKWNDRYINNALPIKALTFMKHVNACGLNRELLFKVSQTIIGLYAGEGSQDKSNSESFMSAKEIKETQLFNQHQNELIAEKFLSGIPLFSDIRKTNYSVDKINELDAIDEVIELLSKKNMELLKELYQSVSISKLGSEICVRSQARLLTRLSNVTSLSIPKEKLSLLKLYAADLNDLFLADLLRDISTVFEKEGKLEVAFELLSKAKSLRPEGVVINERLSAIENKLK